MNRYRFDHMKTGALIRGQGRTFWLVIRRHKPWYGLHYLEVAPCLNMPVRIYDGDSRFEFPQPTDRRWHRIYWEDAKHMWRVA